MKESLNEVDPTIMNKKTVKQLKEDLESTDMTTIAGVWDTMVSAAD
jgi:hypothetical protein